jgi:hypothetical protein
VYPYVFLFVEYGLEDVSFHVGSARATVLAEALMKKGFKPNRISPDPGFMKLALQGAQDR